MNSRGCYCGIWEKNPEFLEKQGVPRGYCGLCDVCKRPGHTRHFPGSVPYTGTWCDWHYRRLAFTHPMSPLGCLVWLTILTSAGLIVRWLAMGS